MKYTLDYLLVNSKLPGRRANLELLYDFRKHASKEIVMKCLSLKNKDLKNTPEEFAIMCGVVGYCEVYKDKTEQVFEFLDDYAQSESWRVREAVAMGIQHMLILSEEDSLQIIKSWLQKTNLHKRAIIAGLCTPRLQSIKAVSCETEIALECLMNAVSSWTGKLTEEQSVLRKALGYCWSIAIEANSSNLKPKFERYFDSENKNIRWILKSNLKKKRLIKLDDKWVNDSIRQIS